MTEGSWKLGVFVDENATDEQADKLVKVFTGRIGDAIDFEIEDIVPFGVETGQPVRFNGMFHPVDSDLTMAEAKRSRINAFGITYEGKSGLSTAEFAWAA